MINEHNLIFVSKATKMAEAYYLFRHASASPDNNDIRPIRNYEIRSNTVIDLIKLPVLSFFLGFFISGCIGATDISNPNGASDTASNEFNGPPDPISCSTWPAAAGFYKDMFVDGGYGVYSFVPHAIEDMGIEYDAFLPKGNSSSVKAEQASVFVGNDSDLNGVLLYPDDSPRFRLVFVNGGSTSSHGISLGEEGRERFRTFYNNGGSYSGACAGAFFGRQWFCFRP